MNGDSGEYKYDHSRKGHSGEYKYDTPEKDKWILRRVKRTPEKD